MIYLVISAAVFVLYAIYKNLAAARIASSNPAAGGWANASKVQIPNRVPQSVLRWENIVRFYANKYQLPKNILLAQTWQENRGKMSPDGAAGEKGIMQLKTIAIQDLKQAGYDVPADWATNPESNIHAGAQFLDLQRRRSGNIYSGLKSVRATGLESYNEGYGGAKRDTGLDEYAEQVMAKARALNNA